MTRNTPTTTSKTGKASANDPIWKWALRNIGGAAIFILLLIIISQICLSLITRHGKEITVPDFTGISVSQATESATNSSLRIVVTDSVFIRRMPRGTVFSQNPAPGSKEKQGRKIRLTINAVNPKKVSMPNLVGLSMRQAKTELSSRGLALGKMMYVSDIATNNVLRQLWRNVEIKSGTPIETGAEIDLVIGLNPDNNITYIPTLSGLKYKRAVDVIHESSMNIKKVTFDPDIKTYSDSLSAVVYKQSPEPSTNPVLIGSEMSIWLSLENKTQKDADPRLSN